MSNRTPPAAPAPLPPLDPLQRYNATQTLGYLRTSRASLYKLINSGKIKTIREAKRIYFPGSEIVRLSSAPS